MTVACGVWLPVNSTQRAVCLPVSLRVGPASGIVTPYTWTTCAPVQAMGPWDGADGWGSSSLTLRSFVETCSMGRARLDVGDEGRMWDGAYEAVSLQVG